jgi:hypothetical protein
VLAACRKLLGQRAAILVSTAAMLRDRYSITSSARSRIDCGTVRPSILQTAIEQPPLQIDTRVWHALYGASLDQRLRARTNACAVITALIVA